MTFTRIQALAELVRRYRSANPDYETVVIISFDNLSEMRAKCTWQLMFTKDKEDYFMGCKVIMRHYNSKDYLAVAYLDATGNISDVVEITQEEMK